MGHERPHGLGITLRVPCSVTLGVNRVNRVNRGVGESVVGNECGNVASVCV